MSNSKFGFLVLMVLVLAGCSMGPGRQVGGPPVYDRSSGSDDGVVAEAPPEQGVAVTPAQRGLVIESPDQAAAPPVAARIDEPAPVRRSNPAVLALLDTAEQQRQQGAMRAAASSLERAQRIAPRDPEVYYRLADIRRQERHWYQAEQLALRGTDLAQGDPVMQKRLWLLIASIRQGAGNKAGAAEATDRARRY